VNDPVIGRWNVVDPLENELEDVSSYNYSMNKLENFIEYLESPSLNGIIFPNGLIKVLSIKSEWFPKMSYSLMGLKESTINDLESEGSLYWSNCAVITELTSEKENIKVVAGESDYGSDGFVGVIDLYSKKLIWLAFFNCSNPFDELEIRGEEIYAKSTAGCLWRFKIKNPVDLTIECR